MGASCSSAQDLSVTLEASESRDILLEEPLLLRLLGAKNLPSMDINSESDVYVIATIKPKRPTPGKANSTARWPVKWDAKCPLWDSCRLVGEEAPNASDRLVLEFMDYDEISKDDLIGTATISIGKLAPGEPLTVPIALSRAGRRAKRKSDGEPTCTIVRELVTASPSQKTLYIVRHGESVWNKAQKDKDVRSMFSDVDHPLNQTGRQQAEALCCSIKDGAEGGKWHSEAVALRDATVVMCSPLTRAIQTCLIGLQPLLLTAPDDGKDRLAISLNPNLREKRNTLGKDSSGKWKGDEVTHGVQVELEKLYADEPETAKALATVPLLLNHVQNRWWLGSAESEAAVADRIAEMIAQIRFRPEKTVIVVGHSHYFREMFRHFRAETCQTVDATGETADPSALNSKKLSNAGIAKCELDFAVSAEKPITNVQLLFNTELIH